MCDTYNCDYLQHSAFRFNWIDFQLNTDFPSQFFFSVKSSSVTKRFLKKMLLKRVKIRRLFFYPNWKQFLVFKIAKFEFMETVHYYNSLWAKCTQLWTLIHVHTVRTKLNKFFKMLNNRCLPRASLNLALFKNSTTCLHLTTC